MGEKRHYLKEELFSLIRSDESIFDFVYDDSCDALTFLDLRNPEEEWISPAFWKLLGYDRTVKQHKSSERFSITNFPDNSGDERGVLKLIRVTQTAGVIQYRHSDGSLVSIRCRSRIIYDGSMKPRFLLGVHEIVERNDRVETNQRLAMHLNNSPLGLVEYDKDLTVTQWSKKCEEIFEWTREEILSNKISAFNLIYEDDLETTSRIAADLISGKVEGNVSLNRNYTKSGKILYCVWYNSVIKDEHGNVTSVMSLVQDVTEQKRYETEVLVEKELSDNILNSLPGVFYLYNRQGRFLRWNRNFTKVTGYTSEEMKQLHPLDFFRGEEKELLKNKIENVFIVGEDSVEAQFVAKNGESTPYYFTGIAIRYEGEECLMGVGIDISRRVKIEKDLLQSEGRYYMASRAAKGGIWEMVPEEGKIYFDENLAEIFGYTPEELSNDLDKWVALVPPEDMAAMTHAMNEVMDGKVASYRIDHRAIRKDGSFSWVAVHGMLATSPDEKPARIVGMSTDITERKNAEAALIESEASLKKAFEIAMIGSWKYDIRHDRYEWSKSALDVVGWNEQDAPTNYEGFLKFMYPDDISALRKEIEAADNAGVFDLEHRMIIHNQIKWVRQKSHIEYDADGVPVTSVGIIHDITESREAKIQLEKSERGLKQAQEISHTGHWELDVRAKRSTWSDEIYRIFGLDPVSVQPSFEKYMSMIHPDDLNYVRARIKESDEARQGITFTHRIIRPDGSIRIVANSNRYMESSDGALVTVYGVIHDITEYRLIQEELNEAYHFNQTIIDTAPIGIWIYEESGKTIAVNKTGIERHGGDKDQLLALNFRELDSWKKWGLYDAALEALKTGKKIRKELRASIPPNDEVWYELTLTPVLFKGKKHLIVMAYDIMDRMMAETALKEREAHLSIATKIAKLAYWEIDLRRDIATFNDEFYAILKTSAEEMGGYTLNLQSYLQRFLHPDDRAAITDHMTRAAGLNDPHHIHQLEHRFYYASGGVGYMLASFYFIRDNDGIPVKAIGASQDITERKEVERSLQRLLQTTTEQNNRLKEFSYITSHNIRSSVVNLLGLTNIILEEPFNQDHIGMLRLNTQKLDTTIRNINELINFENEAESMVKEKCLVIEVVQRVLALNNQSIREKGVHVSIDIPEGLTVMAVPAYIDSVLHNLTTNALKYGITGLAKRIEIAAWSTGAAVFISVRDYGLGIDLEKNREKLFKLGSRLHRISNDSQGLGLFMTRRQVEAMGGAIEVESKVNAGATFKVRLDA